MNRARISKAIISIYSLDNVSSVYQVWTLTDYVHALSKWIQTRLLFCKIRLRSIIL